MSEKNKILKDHLNDGSIFSKWVKSEDDESRENLHRKLTEIELNDEIINQIAEWLKIHHINEKQIKLSEKKKERLKKYGLDVYVKSQNLFPDNDNTKKGNLGEIILGEYLGEITNYELLVYRLRYNPNVNQSMKGDDILMFNKANLKEIIILGEAKFRIPASKSTVEEILNSFGGEPKLPVSLTFIANKLRDQGKDDLADDIEEIQIEMRNAKIPVENIGFIIGNKDTYKSVDNHHLFGDFKITQETIDELEKDSFPIDILADFKEKIFKTETALFTTINKKLNKNELPNLTHPNKEKLFEFTEKKINPNLIFITLSSADPEKLLDSYKIAEELLKEELKNGLAKS